MTSAIRIGNRITRTGIVCSALLAMTGCFGPSAIQLEAEKVESEKLAQADQQAVEKLVAEAERAPASDFSGTWEQLVETFPHEGGKRVRVPVRISEIARRSYKYRVGKSTIQYLLGGSPDTRRAPYNAYRIEVGPVIGRTAAEIHSDMMSILNAMSRSPAMYVYNIGLKQEAERKAKALQVEAQHHAALDLSGKLAKRHGERYLSLKDVVAQVDLLVYATPRIHKYLNPGKDEHGTQEIKGLVIGLTFSPDRPSQADLVRIVKESWKTYQPADTEIQKTSERMRRQQRLAFLFGKTLAVKDWVGTLAEASTSRNTAFVRVQLSGGSASVKTYNNRMSDALVEGGPTLIKYGSPLFRKLAGIRKGDKVKFSGSFVQTKTKDDDFVLETSVTERGSMSEPHFIFRFADIRKVR